MLVRNPAIKLILNVAVLLIAILTFASVTQADAPADEWWDSNYLYRKKITLVAGSSTVPSGYSVSMTFDHASLVSGGKSMASGDDIRIAFWNGSGWTELDRVLDEGSTWDNGSTQVWFKTQAQINSGNSDDNYYLYYKNDGAGSPPASKSNVYVFWDDFESGDLSNWTVQVDAVWSAASDQANSGTYSLKASGYTSGEDKWITANGINESDLLMEAYWRFDNVSGLDSSQGFRSSSSSPIYQYETNFEGTEGGWNISKMINGNWTEIVTNPAGQNPQVNVWTKITTMIVGTNMQVLRDDTQLVPSSGWTDVGTELSAGTVGFRVWEIGSGYAWWIDDVKVRKYVSPEPSNFIGGEERYNAIFSYRKPITIQSGEIGGSCGANITNFPVMVQLTSTDFQEVEDDVDADGFDIIFKAEDDATCGGAGKAPCLLDHEIEIYDEGNDLLLAWVRIPVLDFDDNITIYLYYGNAAVDAPTENPAGVWVPNYVGVWHLKETVTDEGSQADVHTDSTANNNDGDQHGNVNDPTGKIGTGQDFDAGDDYIEGTSNGFSTQAATIDFWIKPNWNGNDGQDHRLYIHEQTFQDWDTNAIYVQFKSGGNLEFLVADETTAYRYIRYDVSGWLAGEWHHIAVSWDSPLTLKMYLEGSEITPTSSYSYGTPGTPTALGSTFTMGGYPPPDLSPGGELDGILDEVRVSNIARDLCWIQTEHSNQDTPTSFYIVGSQESGIPPVQYNQGSFRARNDNGGETDSTWTVAPDTNWTQMVNKNFRVRFLVQETAGVADSGKTFQLEYNRNGGGWNDVTSSSTVVKAAATANVTDGADTTQQLGSGTYVSTNAGFDETDGQVGSMDFAGSDEVEVEFSLQIVGSDVSNGDTIELRVKDLDTYTNAPTITVTGAGTFLYKKSIQIQEGEVTCMSNVTNFPVMVQLTSTDFLEVADDVDDDSFDIIFKAEDDATCGGTGMAPCILDHEIEEYDETTDNRLVAWVRIPVLDYNDNTTIYLYYGNAAVTAATQNPTGVWDSNYKGVWHLKETSGTQYDSTQYGNDGTTSVTTQGSATGKINGADGFSGTLDRVEVGTSSWSASQGTLELWGYPTATAYSRYFFGHTTQPPFNNRIQLFTDDTTGNLDLGLGDNHYKHKDIQVLTPATWYHIALTWDGANYIVYVDGASKANGSYTGLSALHTFADIGNDGDPLSRDEGFNGIIDEVRISNVTRDACWIETEHSNQDTPTSFYVVNPELPSGLSAVVSGTITSSTTETEIVSGGKTIVITLTGDTWVPVGAEFDAQRQNIIDGLNSAQSETNGWNNEVRDKQSVSGVVRTSNTEVTITLDAQAAYDISANETITVTVPASALVTSSSPVDASPTFDITHVATTDLTQTHYRWRNDDGGESAFDTGDGADGALAPNGTFNLNTDASGGRTYADGIAYRIDASTATGNSVDRYSGSVTLSNGIAAGDEVLLINLQGTSGDTTDVGNYEFLEVQSVTATTITFTTDITKSYDGSNAANQKVVVQRVPNYTTVTLDGTDSLTASAWDGLTTTPSGSAGYYTGLVVFRATGTVGVGAGTSITVDGLGYRGGTGGTSGGTPTGGANGESYDGINGSGGGDSLPGTLGAGAGRNNDNNTGTTGTRGGGGGGGAEAGSDTTNSGGGGGGGGYAGGGGGGGGSGDGSSASGAGGSGGGTDTPGGGGGGASTDGAGGAGGDAGLPGDNGLNGVGGAVGSGSTTGKGGGASLLNTDSGGSGGGGGGVYYSSTLAKILHGSAGGGGGGSNEAVTNAPDGGAGGGIIFIMANTVTIDGTLSSDGVPGTQGGPDADPYGASGGGSGGSIMVQANSFTNNATFTATGGAGGALNGTGPAGGGGGGGGVGRIRIEADVRTLGTMAPVPSETGTPGGGSVASWAANEDQTLTGLAIGTNIRVRFLIANEGGASSGQVTYQLEMAETATCGSGSYSTVPGTASSGEHWEIVDSSYINDGQSTFNIDPGLTDPLTGNFTNGELRDDNSNTTGPIDLSAGDFTEIEFAIKTTDYATNGGSYCFRLYDSTNGVALSPSTAYAQVTLASGIFQYRKPITIPSGKVSCAPYVENFPLLVKITDSDLVSKARADGYDIVFRGLDDNVCGGADTSPCGLYHEVERWNSSTGELIAWVRIPRLYSAAANTIYMYYGNPNVRVQTENASAVWDNNNYVVVQHMNGDSQTALVDSTLNGNNVTTEVGDPSYQAGGHIGYGVEFDGNDAVEISDPGVGSSLDLTAQVTVSAWIRPTATGAWNRIVAKSHTANVSPWTMYGLLFDDGSHLREEIASGGAQSGANGTSVIPTDGSWTFATVTYNHSELRVYFNGSAEGTPTNLNTDIDTNDMPLSIARSGFDSDYFAGRIDEVRISSTARDACWIGTEYSNQSDPGDIGSPGFYTIDPEQGGPATAVDLVSFTARGQGSSVLVEWETAQELNSMGFYLYRAKNPWGPFTRLTDKLISGLTFSIVGQKYSYEDKNVTRGEIYYYQLEDLDIYGKNTLHGPICVDWDGDGMPDDWEIAHGLNPGFDDADLDWDGDGLTNLEEYLRGTDPFNPDTDGDGILDGDESIEKDQDDQDIAGTLGPGVYLMESDETGATLELRTDSFDFTVVQAQGQEYERLRFKEYIHGFTDLVGKPELPLKGILLDIPEGSSATLTVLETEAEVHTGYRVYPVPEKSVDDQGQLAHVGETFVIDQAAYSVDAFYPEAAALLGKEYLFRGQQKQQIFFYPLTFNPATGELRHLSRIRVRVDYVDAESLKEAGPEPQVWAPPVVDRSSLDLSSMVESAAWEPPPGASPVYKILVSEEGIYRLTTTWLESKNVTVGGFDLSQVRLYNLGQETAISVYDQDSDNQFDPEDYIDFYGRAVDDSYAKYATENVYWLTLEGGVGAPKRMAETDSTPGSLTVPATHSFTVHHEEDRNYWARAPGGDSLDRYFFHPYVIGEDISFAGAGDPVSFDLSLPGVSGQGTLKIRLGGTWETNHQVAVSLNGTPLGTYSWSGIAFYKAVIVGVDLVDGDNTVTLECLTGLDSIAVDWFEVTYPRSFEANGDSLRFSHETGYRFQVSDFNTDNLLAFDITSPGDVERLVNFETTGTGPYTLDFEPDIALGERTYLALASDQVKTPDAIVEDEYGNLANPASGADYILITHRDLGWYWDGNGDLRPYQWLTDLVSLRQDQGLHVKVVDVEDVFDEFSYGIESPEAIRDFLAHAYTSWAQPAPQYVLLVGDSTRNPKNNPDPARGLDTVTTYLPTYLTYTEHMGETATDEWFARVSGDDAISDLYIGRLPAKNSDEARVMVNKIRAHEGSLKTNEEFWAKNVLLLADDQRDGPEYEYEANFEIMSDNVAALLPEAMNDPFKGYLNLYLDADVLSAQIIDQINSGTLVVNYSGHSSIQILANHRLNYENIFNNSDVDVLDNSGMYPLFISMGCLSGHFVYPEDWNFPSLAEALLRAEDKGAAAALMSTGLTTTEGQHVLDTALFDAIFNQDVRVLGQAVSSAKQTLMANGGSLYEEVNETFLLFGDPAMTLKVPLPQRPQGLSAQGQTASVALSWNAATDCNGGAVSGYNLYRSTTPGGNYTKVNTAIISGTQYDDTSVAAGTTYYYVVTSVDDYDDESVHSQEASGGTQSADDPPDSEDPPDSGGGSASEGGGGGGCFINTVAEK